LETQSRQKILLPNSYSFLLVSQSVISRQVIHITQNEAQEAQNISAEEKLPRQTSLGIPSAVSEPSTGLSPPAPDAHAANEAETEESDEAEVSDKNRRAFLKIAGIAIGSVFASLFFSAKKAEALVFGSSPTSGVVGIKNASNARINPATEETVSTLAKETTVSQLLKTSDLTFESGAVKVKVIDPSSFSDSANVPKSALVDADRHVQVDVLSSALPQSASTEPTLQTIAFGGTKFALRLATDSANSNLEYVGEAQPGTATSAALWRIKRIDSTAGVVIQWADGNASFDNIWDNRESLIYS
jgi:hypothetical protein